MAFHLARLGANGSNIRRALGTGTLVAAIIIGWSSLGSQPSTPAHRGVKLAGSPVITEYALTGGTPRHAGAHGIVHGTDGNFWITLSDSTEIARVTPSGIPSYFPLPTSYANPNGIAQGSDGNIWFTESGTEAVGVMDLTGKLLREYPTGDYTQFGSPSRMVAGPDGNLWFISDQGSFSTGVSGTSYVNRMTTAGDLTHFPVPSPFAGLFDITNGPDGNLWFTERQVGQPGKGQIGRITTAGVVTEYPLAGKGTLGAPMDIAAGPDGNLWFSEDGVQQVGTISTFDQAVGQYPLGPGQLAGGFAMAPDNTGMWFTDAANSAVGFIQVSGNAGAGTPTEFVVPTLGSQPYLMTRGAGTSLWFTESQLPGVATFEPGFIAAPPRQIVFSHGVRSNFREIQIGRGYNPLLDPLRDRYGLANVNAAPAYQDLGFAKPGDPASQCLPTQPRADTNTGPLQAHPDSLSTDSNPGVCDSAGALAYGSTALDDFVQNKPGPIAVIGNSMGGAIIRGWMTLAQDRGASDTTLSKVDKVIFVQGAQQGTYLANLPDVVNALPPGLNGIVDERARATAADFGFDPRRPGYVDLAPRSGWYQNANANRPVPPGISYYNFYSDISVSATFSTFVHTFGPFGNVDLGDLVLLPGSDNPTDVRGGGGARFLPGGSPSSSIGERHQYVTPDHFTVDVAGGPNGIGDAPSNHFKYGDNMNSGRISVASCNGSGVTNPETEIRRVLDAFAVACR